ncbi:MAG: alpha/beta hydrolase [Actinomycetota bacterium]
MEAIQFETEDHVVLEGEIRLPERGSRGAAVLCHAHPQHGGSKDHPLLWATRIELARREFAVLAFNFRGVMGSGGSYGGGEAELADVWAAVGRANELADGPTLLCGWSFGAHVGLRAALEDDRVDALALIGLPLSEAGPAMPPMPDIDEMAGFDRPVLLMAGDADPFCPAAELRALGRKLPRATVRVVPGADHYFSRREREAAAIVGLLASELLPPPGHRGKKTMAR